MMQCDNERNIVALTHCIIVALIPFKLRLASKQYIFHKSFDVKPQEKFHFALQFEGGNWLVFFLKIVTGF